MNATPPSAPSLQKELRIALAGNPNAGKSSLFNQLTGLKQKVGNFPGVTIDRKEGTLVLPDGQRARIADLPGAYSFYPNALDERIALQNLLRTKEAAYDVVIYVVDVTQLERHLLLFSQIADLRYPLILAVNMLDVAEKEGIRCDLNALTDALGIAVVPVNGRTGQGVAQLKELLTNTYDERVHFSFFTPEALAPAAIENVCAAVSEECSPYEALLIAHHHTWLPHLSDTQKNTLAQQLGNKDDFNGIKLQVSETLQRYEKIVKLVEKTLQVTRQEGTPFTERLDRVLTHPVWGVATFLLILFLVFQAIFAWASYPMDLIDAGFAALVEQLNAALPEHLLTRLLTEGIIAGLGGILIFIPQIAILFCLVALLDDVGYMARAVFLSDTLMRKFGLNGKSVVALISGVACAIPAVMSTRTISNWKERVITIFVTPLMSCSARIPVFTVLIAFAVPEETVGGIFNLQGFAMMGLYLMGTTAALLSAWVLKKILRQTEVSSFMMELPSYKAPHWKNIALTVWSKVRIFVVEAGKVILVISAVLWFLASYGPADSLAVAETETTQKYAQTLSEEELAKEIAAQKLEASYAGRLGKFIEPAIAPLGFDWKIGIALITSFAAREVFVGTMATIYSVGSADDTQPLIAKLRQVKNPKTGKLVYDVPTALSLLFFYVFAMQCMSTLAVVYRETNGWKWPLLQLGYMTALAYLVSLLTYQLLS